MTELEKLTSIFNMLSNIEIDCRKVKTMQMQLIITRDAILVIKARVLRYIDDVTKENKS